MLSTHELLNLLDESIKMLESLKYGCSEENQCFCDMSIGNPMYRDHTETCKKTTMFIEKLSMYLWQAKR